jgi:hypothetical protein
VVLDSVEIGDPDDELSSLPAVARLRIEHSEPRGVRCIHLLANGRELLITPTVLR